MLGELDIINTAFSETPRVGISVDAATISIGKDIYNVRNIAPTTGTGGNSLFIIEGSSGIQAPGIIISGGKFTLWYGKIGKNVERISATSVDDLVPQLRAKGVNIVKNISSFSP